MFGVHRDLANRQLIQGPRASCYASKPHIRDSIPLGPPQSRQTRQVVCEKAGTPVSQPCTVAAVRDQTLAAAKPSAKQSPSMASVGIIGAGFSGLCMAIKLQKAGFTNFTIYEAADDIGGTWRANHYPGCACDVQSVMYCYSFEPYPWTQHYSEQPEILQYLHHCADKYQLWDNIRLNTRVTGAFYDEDKAVWRLSTAAGEEEEVQVLVLAQGPLSIPTVPSISGLSEFKGSTMHTAAWDSSMQLQGKRVAVVGTGASAIQVIPKLQQVAKELVVFQRTAPWVLPRKELMPRYAVPAAQHGNKLTLWLQRQAVFWRNELLVGNALVNNKQRLLRTIENMCLKHMKSAIKDPQLQQLLTPDYSIGCKRILASDDYYPALAAENVRLVPAGLKQIKDDGTTLEAANGDVIPDVDIIVFATGFDIKAPLSQFDIRARGAELTQTLTDRPGAYYGLAMAGFPNLFTLLGLNTGLGHHSVVFMAECQINLIIKLLQEQMAAKGHHWVEVTQQAQNSFNAKLQQRLKRTVWLSGCKSWYLTTTAKDSSSADSSSTASNVLDSSGATSGKGNSNSSNSSGAGKGSDSETGGGQVMWPGLCSEFWWRTLWPVARDWSSGKAVHPVAAGSTAAAAVAEQKRQQINRKDTPFQGVVTKTAESGAADKKGL